MDSRIVSKLAEVGVAIPDILLPAKGVPLEKWAVIACDQFTSQPDYWHSARKITGGSPSALDIVLPEAFLSDADELMPGILGNMRAFLLEGVLESACRGFVLVKRGTSSGERAGLLVLLDLERYDYGAGSSSRIRATEGTIAERLPPRAAVRRAAPLEIPHIMVLIDDPGRGVIEPLAENSAQLRPLYGFDLMLGGGGIQGFAVESESGVESVADALLKLDADLTFAVGDGNHSLASAKLFWQEKKLGLTPEEADFHPARYALAELVNIYDPSLVFEPIHRILFTGDTDSAINALEKWDSEQTKKYTSQSVYIATREGMREFVFKNPAHPLAVGSIQAFLDDYGGDIDYIHGQDELVTICEKENAVGFVLPAIDKSTFFDSVKKGGALPKKTFSMGNARDKRYYLEARKITT